MLFLMLLSILISAITLAIAIQKRDAPKSRYFIILILAITFYTLGRAFESVATTLEASYFGVILAYVGLPHVPVIMLLFLLDYYEIKVDMRPLLLIWSPALVVTAMVIIPSLRQYYYLSYQFVPGPPLAQVMVEGTFFYYAMFGYHVLLTTACLALSLWGAIKSRKAARWSSLVVFFSVVFPMLAEILYVLRLSPWQLDLAPIALSVSVLLLCVAVYRLNLLRVLPLAKDAILEQMSDAFIIVDLENRYLEANAAAKRQFSILSELYVGQELDMTNMFANVTQGLDGKMIVATMLNGAPKYYHLSETPIMQSGKKQCTCYTLHDVTDTRKLMAELKAMATYDALTGIYNRASFYQLATHELGRAREQRLPVCAIAIDIDQFKAINDVYGHFCGDEVIKSIVNKISARLRDGDIFGRVGGDEFNILLKHTTAQHAMLLAQELQYMIGCEPCEYNGQQIFATVSIGIAELEGDRHTSLEQLLVDVDSALYEAKNTGRNKACIYHSAGPHSAQ